MTDRLDSLFQAEIARIEVPPSDALASVRRGRRLAHRRRAAYVLGGVAVVLFAVLAVPRLNLSTDAPAPPAQGDRSRLKDNVVLSIESSDPTLSDGGNYRVAVALRGAFPDDRSGICFILPIWVEEASIYDDSDNVVGSYPGSVMEIKEGDEFSGACEPAETAAMERLILQPELHRLEMRGAGKTLGAELAFEASDDNGPPTDETKLVEYQATEALDRGDLETAQELGERYLSSSPPSDNWNHGNVIHYGHLILGHVALRRGDIAEAKAELIRAGHTPGSPQLASFGPNMSLARDLLAAGEEEIVIEYLELLKDVWDFDDDQLAYWIHQIRAGEPPDWDRNLGATYLDPEPYEGD
jgi:hypothetical protein